MRRKLPKKYVYDSQWINLFLSTHMYSPPPLMHPDTKFSRGCDLILSRRPSMMRRSSLNSVRCWTICVTGRLCERHPTAALRKFELILIMSRSMTLGVIRLKHFDRSDRVQLDLRQDAGHILLSFPSERVTDGNPSNWLTIELKWIHLRLTLRAKMFTTGMAVKRSTWKRNYISIFHSIRIEKQTLRW